MRMRVVDYIIGRVYDAGARHIFFVPGTGCMFLTDALARKQELAAVSMHHEQAAGMAALTYSKCTGGIGACVVTTGCGGTNAVTAVLHAWQDNVPCIFISGQAARHQTVRNSGLPLRQMGRQEADIIAVVEPITKYAIMLNDPQDVAYEVEKALCIAESGRKGPVWIDVPMDIQNSIIDTESLRRYEPTHNRVSQSTEKADTDAVFQLLCEAERPVVLVGNGIRLSNAQDELIAFIEKYGIPVTYSRLGHDLIDTENPLSIGMVGMLGASRAGNFALANSDAVLCIGCRLSIDTTGYEYEKFAREAKIFVVDIDETEHSKGTVRIDRFIHADARDFLAKLNEKQPHKDFSEWQSKCLHWKNTFPTMVGEKVVGDRINMYYFTEILSEVLPQDAIVLSDAGNAFFTVSSVIKVKKGQRSITSGGQAEMGYALPGAIGAAYAGGTVIAVNGDGSVMMNLQELETIAFNKLSIKLFIMNNNGYSSIRHLQDNAFRGRQIGCDPTSGVSFPNFEKIAAAFELPYVRLQATGDIRQKLADVINTTGPVVCEVMCDENQQFLTVSCALNSKKRLVNRPLEDQSPFLDRDVFLNEMIVEPLD